MKKLIVIIFLAAIVLYGKFYGLPYLHNSPIDLAFKEHIKCITKEGNVIYGDVPQGVVCERWEPVTGSLTIEHASGNASAANINTSNFTCNGRTLCPQMTSCEEAKFFLRNCPNTSMDGDHDGIPCEIQWCN